MSGTFIVLEGTDGSGKAEQFARLMRRLKEAHIPYFTVDFPRYGHAAAYFVERYLRGEYGAWDAIDPRAASLFYALDRFDAASGIRAALKRGMVVVANRYVASNMGHQGSKINSSKERKAFLRWIVELEFERLGIPRPDLNIILRVPPKIAFKLIMKKARRAYLRGKKRDAHEADFGHIARTAAVYREIVEANRREFTAIDCAPRMRLLTKEAIEERVWDIVRRLLAKKGIRVRQR